MGEVRGWGDLLITGISILQVTQLLQSYMFNYHPDIGRAKGVQYKKMFLKHPYVLVLVCA